MEKKYKDVIFKYTELASRMFYAKSEVTVYDRDNDNVVIEVPNKHSLEAHRRTYTLARDKIQAIIDILHKKGRIFDSNELEEQKYLVLDGANETIVFNDRTGRIVEFHQSNILASYHGSEEGTKAKELLDTFYEIMAILEASGVDFSIEDEDCDRGGE